MQARTVAQRPRAHAARQVGVAVRLPVAVLKAPCAMVSAALTAGRARPCVPPVARDKTPAGRKVDGVLCAVVFGEAAPLARPAQAVLARPGLSAQVGEAVERPLDGAAAPAEDARPLRPSVGGREPPLCSRPPATRAEVRVRKLAAEPRFGGTVRRPARVGGTPVADEAGSAQGVAAAAALLAARPEAKPPL